MRYLITGGAGFIGSHLAQQLLENSHAVIVLDDLSTGRESNIAHLRSQAGFQFIQDSVESESAVDAAMAQCDSVFHLASAVGVQLIVDNPVRTISTTVHGTEVVLESANKLRRPVLITSSSEVYGKGTRVPFSEDDDVVMGPTRHSRWCYAYAKGIDEFLGLAYHKQFGLPVTIVRLFNTVGPRQIGMYGMVLPRFAAAALANKPLQVYGDGKQTRCFCHVSDVVAALIRLSDDNRHAGQVFNLGSDEEISIDALARRVIKSCDSSSPIEFVPYEKAYGQAFDDLARRVPKLDRIRSAIAFEPRFSLDQIIKAVIDEQKLIAAGSQVR
jgi:UDP-glucose 4-epimerase